MIKFHNPAAKTAVAPEQYELSCDLRPNEGADLTVALLANGFPDSEQFLGLIEKSLLKLSPGLTIRRYNKGNASIPASDGLLASISDECQALVTAYGH